MTLGGIDPLKAGLLPPSLGLALAEYTSAVANYAISVELQDKALQAEDEARAVAALHALADEMVKLTQH
jgi:hypothetical protein